MLVLDQPNLTLIEFANASISVASISVASITELFNTGIEAKNKNLIEAFIQNVNTKFKYNMAKTILINEPNGYGQFLHVIEEQHTNELFAVYELINVDLAE